MSEEPLDLLTFDETPSWLNAPPPVFDEPPPWLDEPQSVLDESVQATSMEDAQSSSSSNHPGFEHSSSTDGRLLATADFETSQRNFGPEDSTKIHIFFHNIRLEEYERVNKKRRMRADHSEESSFRMDNNESDAMGWSHGKKQRNPYSSSNRLSQVPTIAGLSEGLGDSPSRPATTLPPIGEFKDLSIDMVPSKMQSSRGVESPKAVGETFPTSISHLEAGIVDSADAFSSPRPPQLVEARPITEDDFLASNWDFKPGYQADIEIFFHDIRVEEARKMGRPEPTMHSFHWGSDRRGRDSTLLENGEFNSVPDEWGQPDEAEGGNLGGWGGQPDDVPGDNPVAWGGQPGDAQGNNSGDWGANNLNSGTSHPVTTQAYVSWNTSADAGQSEQAVIKEHADFSWNDTTDAGPSDIATNQQWACLPTKVSALAGPSKNTLTQEDAAINLNEIIIVGKKLAAKDLTPKRKTRGAAGWESNNSHPIYAADEYVWSENTDESWTGRQFFGGSIIRTRAGNKGRGKRGGSQWDSGISHPTIVGGNSKWIN